MLKNKKIIPFRNRAAPATQSEAGGDSLGDYVRDLCLVRGEFRLACGKKSDFYFNMKPLMMAPPALRAASAALAKNLPQDIDYIGGLEMGAVPLTAALLTLDACADMRGFFIRKQAKGHGLQKRLEGLAEGKSLTGKKIALIDDVTTTGQSVLEAAAIVRAAGGSVEAALTLLDREEGAKENMAKAGIPLIACLKAGDLL